MLGPWQIVWCVVLSVLIVVMGIGFAARSGSSLRAFGVLALAVWATFISAGWVTTVVIK